MDKGEGVDFLRLLVTSQKTPEVILQHLGKETLKKKDGTVVLSELYQRHPDLVRSSVEELSASNKEEGEKIKWTLLDLAMVRITPLFVYSACSDLLPIAKEL